MKCWKGFGKKEPWRIEGIFPLLHEGAEETMKNFSLGFEPGISRIQM
jgi:hypothetical protein